LSDSIATLGEKTNPMERDAAQSVVEPGVEEAYKRDIVNPAVCVRLKPPSDRNVP